MLLDNTRDITNIINKQTPQLPFIDGFGCVYNITCTLEIDGSAYHFNENVIYNTTDKAYVQKSVIKSFDSDITINSLEVNKVQRVKYGFQDT